jgi:selenocysteine-specific elongation factor
MPGRHFIVATAGHVDHGKSALVTALTGTDPDRLPEEKARGITIDLGFAAFDVAGPAGETFHVGIVDVPGHEDFVKNMAAGVGAADVALLVVGGDDGWMPQTEEHLQILTYFGVSRAVVALTKADLVADVGKAADAVRQRLHGTAFAEAPIVPTSVVGRYGIDELTATIGGVLSVTRPAADIGKPRLPVDRVFTLAGIGTVVTGTLRGGTLRQGQRIVVLPSGQTTWIRRMQSHNRDADVRGPGSRIAVNLPDVGAGDVRRGDVVALDVHGTAASVLDVHVEISPRAQRPLRSGVRVRVHYGSGNTGARIVLLDGPELAVGGRALAQLRLDRPVCVFDGDRLAIRDWAEQSTLAGGIVLDAGASPRGVRGAARRRHLTRRAEAIHEPAAWIESLLERDTFVRCHGLLGASVFSEAEIEEAVGRLVTSGVAAIAGQDLWLATAWAGLLRRATETIDASHRQHPDRPGMPLTELKSTEISIDATAFDALLAGLGKAGFVRDGNIVRRATHRPALPPALEATASSLRDKLAGKPFDPPSRGTLAPDPTSARALRYLLETGEAVEVNADLVMTSEHLARARDLVVTTIREQGPATLGDIRTRLECSRRVLVPLLEYFDRTGVTVRHGDRRSLRRSPAGATRDSDSSRSS